MSPAAVCPQGNAEPVDLRDSDAYIRLERVFSELESPQQHPAPDWQDVTDNAENLLAQYTDLRIACWRIFALRQLQQVSQSAVALKQLSETIAHSWDHCLPERDRGKLAALRWLHSAFSRELSASPDAPGALAPLRTAAHQLGAALKPYAADVGGNWQQLAAVLQPIVSEQPAAPEPTSINVAPNTIEPVKTGQICNAREAQKQLRHLQEAAAPLLDWWLSQPERRSCSVLLSRALIWAGIYQLPQHDINQHTSLKPPPAERRKHCETLWQRTEYAVLLTELEASLRKAPFWLDGHYLAARCCEALQDQPAADTIHRHTQSLIQRLPGVEKLSFDDGSPFAAQATQHWLVPVEPPASQRPSEPETGDLLALQRNDGFRAAASALAQQLQTAKGERARAVGRMQLARLLLADGKKTQARELLEPALAQLQQSMPLALWDQQLLSDTLDLLQQSLADQRDDSARQRRNTLQQQLRWLNVEYTLDQAARPAQHGEN